MKISSKRREGLILMLEDKTDLTILYIMFVKFKPKILSEILWQFKVRRRGVKRKGERKKVRVKITVEKAYIQDEVENIRITGRVIEASEDIGVKGRRVGLTIKVGDEVSLEGLREEELEEYLIEGQARGEEVAILVFDEAEATLAILNERIKIVYSEYYGGYRGELDSILEKIQSVLRRALREAVNRKTKLIISSSSIFSRRIKRSLERVSWITFIEKGVPGSPAGIYELLNSNELRSSDIRNPLVAQTRALDSIVKRLKEGELLYGLESVLTGLGERGCREIILTTRFTYNLLTSKLEQYIKLIKEVKRVNGRVLIVSSKGSLGRLVERLGGIVGL